MHRLVTSGPEWCQPCWLDEVEPKRNYSKTEPLGRGLCGTCHVHLKDPAYQPDGAIENAHRGQPLEVTHMSMCPGACPGIHRCVQVVLYGKSLDRVKNLTKGKTVSHTAEIRHLVDTLKRKEKQEKKERELRERQDRERQREEDRAHANERIGTMFSLLEQTKSREVDGTVRMSREDLDLCLRLCQDLSESQRDTTRSSVQDGMVHTHTIYIYIYIYIVSHTHTYYIYICIYIYIYNVDSTEYLLGFIYV